LYALDSSIKGPPNRSNSYESTGPRGKSFRRTAVTNRYFQPFKAAERCERTARIGFAIGLSHLDGRTTSDPNGKPEPTKAAGKPFETGAIDIRNQIAKSVCVND
jgi:hypothetical protein